MSRLVSVPPALRLGSLSSSSPDADESVASLAANRDYKISASGYSDAFAKEHVSSEGVPCLRVDLREGGANFKGSFAKFYLRLDAPGAEGAHGEPYIEKLCTYAAGGSISDRVALNERKSVALISGQRPKSLVNIFRHLSLDAPAVGGGGGAGAFEMHMEMALGGSLEEWMGSHVAAAAAAAAGGSRAPEKVPFGAVGVPEGVARRIIRQVLLALSFLHNRAGAGDVELAHLDVTPSNVLVITPGARETRHAILARGLRELMEDDAVRARLLAKARVGATAALPLPRNASGNLLPGGLRGRGVSAPAVVAAAVPSGRRAADSGAGRPIGGSGGGRLPRVASSVGFGAAAAANSTALDPKPQSSRSSRGKMAKHGGGSSSPRAPRLAPYLVLKSNGVTVLEGLDEPDVRLADFNAARRRNRVDTPGTAAVGRPAASEAVFSAPLATLAPPPPLSNFPPPPPIASLPPAQRGALMLAMLAPPPPASLSTPRPPATPFTTPARFHTSLPAPATSLYLASTAGPLASAGAATNGGGATGGDNGLPRGLAALAALGATPHASDGHGDLLLRLQEFSSAKTAALSAPPPPPLSPTQGAFDFDFGSATPSSSPSSPFSASPHSPIPPSSLRQASTVPLSKKVYMRAPELDPVELGGASVTKADIWATAILLLQLLGCFNDEAATNFQATFRAAFVAEAAVRNGAGGAGAATTGGAAASAMPESASAARPPPQRLPVDLPATVQSPQLRELLMKMLALHPADRATAEECLSHPWMQADASWAFKLRPSFFGQYEFSPEDDGGRISLSGSGSFITYSKVVRRAAIAAGPLKVLCVVLYVLDGPAQRYARSALKRMLEIQAAVCRREGIRYTCSDKYGEWPRRLPLPVIPFDDAFHEALFSAHPDSIAFVEREDALGDPVPSPPPPSCGFLSPRGKLLEGGHIAEARRVAESDDDGSSSPAAAPSPIQVENLLYGFSQLAHRIVFLAVDVLRARGIRAPPQQKGQPGLFYSSEKVRRTVNVRFSEGSTAIIVTKVLFALQLIANVEGGGTAGKCHGSIVPWTVYTDLREDNVDFEESSFSWIDATLTIVLKNNDFDVAFSDFGALVARHAMLGECDKEAASRAASGGGGPGASPPAALAPRTYRQEMVADFPRVFCPIRLCQMYPPDVCAAMVHFDGRHAQALAGGYEGLVRLATGRALPKARRCGEVGADASRALDKEADMTLPVRETLLTGLTLAGPTIEDDVFAIGALALSLLVGNRAFNDFPPKSYSGGESQTPPPPTGRTGVGGAGGGKPRAATLPPPARPAAAGSGGGGGGGGGVAEHILACEPASFTPPHATWLYPRAILSGQFFRTPERFLSPGTSPEAIHTLVGLLRPRYEKPEIKFGVWAALPAAASGDVPLGPTSRYDLPAKMAWNDEGPGSFWNDDGGFLFEAAANERMRRVSAAAPIPEGGLFSHAAPVLSVTSHERFLSRSDAAREALCIALLSPGTPSKAPISGISSDDDGGGASSSPSSAAAADGATSSAAAALPAAARRRGARRRERKTGAKASAPPGDAGDDDGDGAAPFASAAPAASLGRGKKGALSSSAAGGVGNALLAAAAEDGDGVAPKSARGGSRKQGGRRGDGGGAPSSRSGAPSVAEDASPASPAPAAEKDLADGGRDVEKGAPASRGGGNRSHGHRYRGPRFQGR